MTENVSNVWGGTDLPYLNPAETSGEDAYPQYASEALFSKDEFLNKLKTKAPDIVIDFNQDNWMEILEFTPGK